MEHVDQILTGGRDQLRFYIIHSNNTNFYVCPDKRKRKLNYLNPIKEWIKIPMDHKEFTAIVLTSYITCLK